MPRSKSETRRNPTKIIESNFEGDYENTLWPAVYTNFKQDEIATKINLLNSSPERGRARQRKTASVAAPASKTLKKV